MTEALESVFAIQKRGDRWCLIHAESGIMHERNFSHKAMAKQFGMELTAAGFVPEGADRVSEMLRDEERPVSLTEEDVLSVNEDGSTEKVEMPPPTQEPTNEVSMPNKSDKTTYKTKPGHRKSPKKKTMPRGKKK